jgi:uncharacterized cupredoxin-like copper-binding protein
MPFYKKVAFLGLGLFIAAFAVLLVGILIEDPAGVVFVAITVAVALVIGFLMSRNGTWTYAVGALGGIVGLVFFGPDIPQRITTPGAFFDFVAVVFVLIGLLAMIGGSIVGYLQSRASAPRTEALPVEARAIRGIGIALVALAVLSAGLTVLSMESVSAADRQGAIEMKMKKVKFVPDSIEVSRGSAQIVVKNSDVFLHTFTLDDAGIDVKLTPGSEKIFDLGSLSAGTYVFRCAIFGHDDMVGTLTVR